MDFKGLLDNLGKPVPIVPPQKNTQGGFFTGLLDTLVNGQTEAPLPSVMNEIRPDTPETPTQPDSRVDFVGLLDNMSNPPPQEEGFQDAFLRRGDKDAGFQKLTLLPNDKGELQLLNSDKLPVSTMPERSEPIAPNGYFAGLLDNLSQEPTSEDVANSFTPNAVNSQKIPGRSDNAIPRSTTVNDPRQTWQDAEQKLYEAQNKDYSKAQYDEQGNLIKAAGKDRDKSWTFWDKVGSTLLGALTGFSQGGLGGAIAGGISAGTNRNYLEQLQNQMVELPKAQKQADYARKQYETSLKLNGAENDETRAWRDDYRKSQRALEDSHKAFLDTLIQDDIFDEKDSDAYFSMTGQRIAPFDKRKRTTMKRNGETIESADTVGVPWNPSVGVPTELVEKPVGVTQTNPDGKDFTVPMLPKDAGNFQYRAGKDAAAAAAQQQRFESGQQFQTDKVNFSSVQDWREKTNKARSTFNASQNAIKGLNTSIAEVEQQIEQYKGKYDTSDLERRLDGLKKQKADRQLESDKASGVMNAPKPSSFNPTKPKGVRSRRSSVSINRDPMGLYR